MLSLPKAARSIKMSATYGMQRCFIPQAWNFAACCQRLNRQASHLTVTDIESTLAGIGQNTSECWRKTGWRISMARRASRPPSIQWLQTWDESLQKSDSG